MARPLRIEYEGALYHVTSRGDRQEAIYEDDEDRRCFLSVLERVVVQCNWICYAYCQMTNHYHLLIETPDANLSRGMRHLNGVFTQLSNRRHKRSGHLFQGRYKAILVDSDAYLSELSRYIVLNPVRAGMVEQPESWHWSSYPAMCELAQPALLLGVDQILSLFGSHRKIAVKKYQEFVMQGLNRQSPWVNLKKQIYLGDEAFVKKTRLMLTDLSDDVNVSKIQKRRAVKSLDQYAGESSSRNVAIVSAYASGGYSYQDIGAYFGLHFTSVGKIVRKSLSEA
ncbi:FIG00679443: hypothetical protein [hydrothermal vent metagenome]|uniref:Transposase IS200-like domain-containing protein n=1 Tax=hydrothermal vent metagenome TaxID=652676 RepID=A0A3B0X0L0_9ZZZZ